MFRFSLSSRNPAVNLFTWYCVAAVFSGLMLSAAFPPLEWDGLIWFAFLPMLLIPQPGRWRERVVAGYLWGYVHCASSLLWLNEVGFGAGWLLALYCALFPMTWYFLFSAAVWHFRQPAGSDFPGAGLLYISSLPKNCCLAIFGSASWCALEWIRSWLFTGFPWNQLGISQFERIGLLQCAAYTGVYGISFLIVLVNMVLAMEFCQAIRRISFGKGAEFPKYLVLASLFFLPVCYWAQLPGKFEITPDSKLLVMAVQGNMPQMREWTEAEFRQALRTYSSLTLRDAPHDPRPDLIVWPECAVPAPIDEPEYNGTLRDLLQETQIPLLVGATNWRYISDFPSEPSLFNSAFLLNKEMKITGYYDKVHRVPFGEYVPGSHYFPWLVDWIGMGRDLTPGRAFNLFHLPNGALAGVNICFEDVFPEISREFTRNGANILMTITNDSWYNESAGARQHLSHVIFRAVECRRPFLRSGNNSHTCMISPFGEIMGILQNEDTGDPFYAGTMRFELPVSKNWGETFYTRYGNLFALGCVGISLVFSVLFFAAWFTKKRRQQEAIAQE